MDYCDCVDRRAGVGSALAVSLRWPGLACRDDGQRRRAGRPIRLFLPAGFPVDGADDAFAGGLAGVDRVGWSCSGE